MMRRALVAALLVPVLAGCGGAGLELEQLPAPKGVSGPTYHVTAQFDDVSNLVIGATVKLQGVVVGVVTSIGTKDFHANVGLDIEKKFPLAASSTFEVRFSTPLGEDFIAVTTADKPGQKLLADGAVIGVKQTSDAPGIEDTFAALSLLLNGGGLSKLHTIAGELDAALKGRTGNVRDALIQLHTVIANFDANKDDFDRTLTGLQKMSAALNDGQSTVIRALDEFPATLRLLADDTAQIRTLLGKVATLGDTVKGLLDRSQADMLTDFDELRPTLDALAASESNLVPTFDSLIKFGQLFDRATPGDYLNVSVSVQFLLNAVPERPRAGGTLPTVTAATTTSADAVASLLGGTR